jgi:hypothetical protein
VSIAAVELGTTGAAGAAEGAGAGAVGRRAGEPFRYATPRAGRAAARPSPRPLPAPRPSRPAPGAGRPPTSPARTRPRQRSFYSEARRRAPTTRIHRTNYQPVILAEFVAAVLLVSISPIASKKNPKGLSPYAGQDMIKIGAVTATYFVLALISSTGQEAGRWAAWFGGLILLAVGLNEAASVAKTLDLAGFGGSPANSDQVTGTTQTGSTIAGRN